MASMKRDDRLRALAMSAVRSMLTASPGYADQPTFLASKAVRIAIEIDRVIGEAVDDDEGVRLLRMMSDMAQSHSVELRRMQDEIDSINERRST